jgi:hypothetical protein
MEKTDLLATCMQIERLGHGFTVPDAFECIAELVGEQDPADDLYDVKVEQLLRLGACLWSLRRKLMTQHCEQRRGA